MIRWPRIAGTGCVLRIEGESFRVLRHHQYVIGAVTICVENRNDRTRLIERRLHHRLSPYGLIVRKRRRRHARH